MPVELNHTILKAHDRRGTAEFIAEILGLPEPESFADDHFLIIRLSNDSSIDVMRVDDPFDMEHYAFKVSEEEFDQIFGRIKAKDVKYWADPFMQVPDQINELDGGRGVYFLEPGGHSLEVLTKPYGKETEALGLQNERRAPGKFPGA
ncbi:VOC family protein [Pseudonocardia kongjuensis]|uniref:VOC family protein n=1 Tax=Pseudonocardia kongjuensis TaxID=102227 RepID=A0ABP4I4N3_9PSEU